MKINLILVVLIFFCVPAISFAHDAFKEPLQTRYNLKTVSCKTCHPNNKDRTIHNEFGKLIELELKGKGITQMFKEAEAKGEEAVKAVEPEMAKIFIEALKVVEKKKMSFEDLLKFGLLNGVRVKDK